MLRRPFLQHLRSASDLVTTYEEVRAGFIALALERNRRATPHVEQARALKIAASKAKSPIKVMDIPEIRPALITAAGVSDKAAGHMLEEDKEEAVKGLIAKFLEPAGTAFVEELVFRFLLTRGDTLGGSMRNVGGALAQRKLTRAIVSGLRVAGTRYTWLHSTQNTWMQMPDDDTDIELHLRGISWKVGRKSRTAVYNLNVPIVKNNVDLCLLDCVDGEIRGACSKPSTYVALGELKGGIDPAGADEHWKTAATALLRITLAFRKSHVTPATFFVGAAIAKKMADEIWSQLEAGTLTNAANLTGRDQVASLCAWLISL